MEGAVTGQGKMGPESSTAIQIPVSAEDFGPILETYRELSIFLDSLTPAGRRRKEMVAAPPIPVLAR